jgi:hypothetical protein
MTDFSKKVMAVRYSESDIICRWYAAKENPSLQGHSLKRRVCLLFMMEAPGVEPGPVTPVPEG